MAGTQRTLEARKHADEAAHKPHGRKHRGMDVLLELDTTRNGLPFLLRREKAMCETRLRANRHHAGKDSSGDFDAREQGAKPKALTRSDKRLLDSLLGEAVNGANLRLARRLLHAGVTVEGKSTLVNKAKFREEQNLTYGRTEKAANYARMVRLLERHGAVLTRNKPFEGYLTAYQNHLAKRSLTDELVCDEEPWVKDAMKALRKAEAIKRSQ